MGIKVVSYVEGRKEFNIPSDRPIKVKDLLYILSIDPEQVGMIMSGERSLSLEDEVLPGSEIRLIPITIGG